MNSIVTRMVNDYRRYVDRQEEKAYRADRDRVSDERWAYQERRARDRHEAYLEDRDYQKDERQRVEDGRTLFSDMLNEAATLSNGETKAVPAANEWMQHLNTARGNSARGEQLVFRSDEQGNIGLGTAFNDGTLAPFTIDPTDNDSAQIHIRAEDKERLIPFVGQIMENLQRQNPELNPQALSQVLNQMLEVNDDGSLVPAPVERFQGSVQQVSKKDVPYSKTFENDGAFGVIGRAASDTFDFLRGDDEQIANNRRMHQSDTVMFPESKEISGERTRKFWFGKKEEDEKKGERSTETIIEQLFTPKGQLKSSQIKTLDDLNAIARVGEDERSNKRPVMVKTHKKTLQSIAQGDIQTVALPKTKRKRYAAELVRLGALSPQQGLNLLETGDVRYDRFALQQKGLQTKSALLRYLKAEKDLIGNQNNKMTPKDWKQFDDLIKPDLAESVRTVFRGLEAKDIKDRVAPLTTAVRLSVKELNLNPRNYADPVFRESIKEAAQRYLRYNGDFKPKSISTFIKTAAHGLHPSSEQYDVAVEKLLALSSALGMSEMKVGKLLDAQVERVKAAQAEQGLSVGLDEAQIVMLIDLLQQGSNAQ